MKRPGIGRPSSLDRDALRALRASLPPQRILTADAARVSYDGDASPARGLPDAVVLPETTGEVAAIAAWAHAHRIALIARGAGTGLAGGAVATDGGVIVELSRMRAIRVDPESRVARVQPGVTGAELEAAARRHGLTYPPDPSSGTASTIGGHIACNAGGPRCLAYGVTQRYVVRLEVVLADGRIAHTGPAVLDTDGPSWDAVLTGSEGTLAIVTGAVLRLAGIAPGRATLLAAFPDVRTAGAAVSAVIAGGHAPTALELMDRRIMQIVEAHAPSELPTSAGAALVLEIEGQPAGLSDRLDRVADLMVEVGASSVRTATDDAARAAIWKARKSAGGAMSRLAPTYYSTDVTVPRARIAEAVDAVDEICATLDLQIGYVSHAGDGNMHPLILLDPSDPAHLRRVMTGAQRIAAVCVGMGGSITGEHGVGREKRGLLTLQHDPPTIDAMRDLKSVFDPTGRLNPGKVLPAAGDPGPAPDGIEAPDPIAARDHDRAVEAPRASPDDLTIRAPADASVRELLREAGASGLRLALAAPWDMTVGDLLAAGLESPHRLRYGGLRDQLLAARIRLPDGRIIRAGRPVVKNVAGYDLHRLLVGAGGSLGHFEEVTLRLHPAARAGGTLVIPAPDLMSAVRTGLRSVAGAWCATAITVVPGVHVRRHDAPWCVVYAAEGDLTDVRTEMDAIAQSVEASPRWSDEDVPGSDADGATRAWAAALGEVDPAHVLRLALPCRELPAWLDGGSVHLRGARVVAVDVAHGCADIVPTAREDLAALASAVRSAGGHLRPLLLRGGDGARVLEHGGPLGWLTDALAARWSGSIGNDPSNG